MNARAPILCLCSALLGFALDADATEDKYGITSAEHAAFDADVESLCIDHVQSEDQPIGYMKFMSFGDLLMSASFSSAAIA